MRAGMDPMSSWFHDERRFKRSGDAIEGIPQAAECRGDETNRSLCASDAANLGVPDQEWSERQTMSTTVYVIGFEPAQHAWIEAALGRGVDRVVRVDDSDAWLAHAPSGPGQCLIASADVDGAAILRLVRALRGQGNTLPVIVLGPHSEFRTAVDIARLEATDFLERPVSIRVLRAAVRRIQTDPQ